MGNGDYCRIPIDYILTFEKMPFDIYIKITDKKIVKLSNREAHADQVQKYKDKGIESVYVCRNDFEKFQKYINNSNSKKFFEFTQAKPLVAVNDKISEGFQDIIEKFQKLGVSPADIRESQKMAMVALDSIESVPDILDQLCTLSQENGEVFIRSLMTGLTSGRIVETFTWQTTAIKKKLMMSAMLSEATLNTKELEELESWERGEILTSKLSASIINHPKLIVNKLERGRKKNFPVDLLTIIEQHHERPDGTGFPNGFRGPKVVLLACIQIIAKEFVLALEECDFEPTKRDEIIANIGNKFVQGNYRSATVALGRAF